MWKFKSCWKDQGTHAKSPTFVFFGPKEGDDVVHGENKDSLQLSTSFQKLIRRRCCVRGRDRSDPLKCRFQGVQSYDYLMVNKKTANEKEHCFVSSKCSRLQWRSRTKRYFSLVSISDIFLYHHWTPGSFQSQTTTSHVPSTFHMCNRKDNGQTITVMTTLHHTIAKQQGFAHSKLGGVNCPAWQLFGVCKKHYGRGMNWTWN